MARRLSDTYHHSYSRYGSPSSRRVWEEYLGRPSTNWESFYSTYYKDYRNRSPYARDSYQKGTHADCPACLEEDRGRVYDDTHYQTYSSNYQNRRRSMRDLYEGVSSPSRRKPTQTVEIVEERLDDIVDHEATSSGQTQVGLATKLNPRSRSNGYIDTIVNFNDDGTNLKIANVVHIGDRFITKEWECGDEWEKKYGNRQMKGTLDSPLRDLYDTATGHAHSPNRSTTRKQNDTYAGSIIENPTFQDIEDDNMQLTTLHDGCELCQKEAEFIETRSRGSISVKSQKTATNKNTNNDRWYSTSKKTKPTNQNSTSPLKTGSGANVADLKRTGRKTVTFNESQSEFRPDYSIYSENRVSKSPARFGESFTRYEFDEGEVDDECDLDISEAVPFAPNNRVARSTITSATKNITKQSPAGRRTEVVRPTKENLLLPENNRPSSLERMANARKRYTLQGLAKEQMRRSTSSGRSQTIRASNRRGALKTLAENFKKYAQLEYEEVKLRDKLCSYKNYNIDFAFKLLNPKRGVVNAQALHDALQTSLSMKAIEKSVIVDIIERLAYVNDQELSFTDMKFFEPDEDDVSYDVYSRNIASRQDPRDTSWHDAYKSLWNALMRTVQTRRYIQKDMYTYHPGAVDLLFQNRGLTKSDKLDIEELEDFMEEQGVVVDYDLAKCLLKTLDRDQDNKASYEEISDAIFGAD